MFLAAVEPVQSVPSPARVAPSGFEWLRNIDEVRVQVPRDGGVERLRYARVLPASTFAPDVISLRWEREGAVGEDRFECDRDTGEWRVRLRSLATAAAVEFRGPFGDLAADGLRLRFVARPEAHVAFVEARGDSDAWHLVERAVFRLRR